MVSQEFEELTWIVAHGRGVLNTAQSSKIAGVLSQAGLAAGKEAYYYMRYDDSPERVQMPIIYYTVFGNPDIKIVLPEEVEPVGNVFDTIAVLDSSMLLHSTSQRALLLDGAKKNAALVVNTSLKPEAVLKLVKKYNCAKDWEGTITCIKASKYHPNLVFGMLGAITKTMKNVITIDNVLDALETLGNKSDAIEAVERAYEEVEPVRVRIKAEDCEPFKLKSKLIEAYKNLQEQHHGPWDKEQYEELKRRVAEAPTYELRHELLPSWESLAPGLIEFNPSASERNIGFKTAFSRIFRPELDKGLCIDCKLCHIFCPEGAVDFKDIRIDYDYCTGCGICAGVCGPHAIIMVQEMKALEDMTEEEVLTMRRALIEYNY